MDNVSHFIKDKQGIIYWHLIHPTITDVYFYMADRYIVIDNTDNIIKFVAL